MPKTYEFKLKGYMDYKADFVNLKYKICGDEVLTAVLSTPPFFALQYIEGANPDTLLASERYHTINEATFAAYFSLTPSNTQCIVKKYEIW